MKVTIYLISGILSLFNTIYCSSYAGYITIEKELIAGDDTKIIGELPMQKKVTVEGERKNKYIINYNSSLAEIDKRCLRFPKDEQPYIYPYWGMKEPIYEFCLELYKGEEYRVIGEDNTRYLVEYPLKNTKIEVWVEKNNALFNELSRLERFEKEQIEKGFVKHNDKWVIPEERDRIIEEERAKLSEYIRQTEEKRKYEEIQWSRGFVKYGEAWITKEQMQEINNREVQKKREYSERAKRKKGGELFKETTGEEYIEKIKNEGKIFMEITADEYLEMMRKLGKAYETKMDEEITAEEYLKRKEKGESMFLDVDVEKTINKIKKDEN